MSANPFSFEAFADWCDKQGNRHYVWHRADTCACAQYASHLGVFDQWNEGRQKNDGFWRKADRVASRCSRFDDLAQHLRKRKPYSDDVIRYAPALCATTTAHPVRLNAVPTFTTNTIPDSPNESWREMVEAALQIMNSEVRADVRDHLRYNYRDDCIYSLDRPVSVMETA